MTDMTNQASVYEGMTGTSDNVFIDTKNRSHTITADMKEMERRP